MLACAYPALDRPMILFQDVVEILHRSMPAILLQSLLGFEPHDGRWITGVLVGVDDPRRRMVLSAQSLSGSNCLHLNRPETDDARSIGPAYQNTPAKLQHCPGPSTDQTAESYAAIVDTNVLSTLLSMKHELRVMLAQGSWSIVNVSCTCDRAGAPGSALYVASKHAVEGFTKAAALEFAETGVRINVVAPGTIETGMLNRFTGTPENKADLISRVPMKRIAQPEEIAEAILFLASMSLAADGGERSGSMDPPGIFEISRCRSFSASEWLLSLWHPGFLNFGTDFVRNSPNFATLSQRKSRSPHRERRPPRGGSFRRARDEEIRRSIS
jgi:hypothetical protein